MSGRLVKNRSYKQFNDLAQIMDRQLAADIKRDTRKKMVREVLDPLAVKVKSSANGRHGALAAESVQPKDGAKPYLEGGGARSPLFWGSEFGGGSNKRWSEYYTRSRSGKKYRVRRRTTQQFREHRGQEGYWFNPTIEANLEPTLQGIADIISDTVERHL